MKTFFASLGGAVVGSILGLILLFFIGVGIIQMMVNDAIKSASGPSAGQADGHPIVLTMDLRTPLPDQAATTGPEVLFGQPTGFVDVLTKLDAAVKDDQVKGVFIRASEFGLGSAKAEELRSAFLKLKAADKFVIAHTQGSYGGGPSSYRVIAPADEIWIQPGADLMIGGIVFETLFLKGLFDNLSITPEFEAFYEYKNAVNTYEQTDYTEPHRRAMTELAQSIWDVSLVDIAADRGMTVQDAEAALVSSPIDSQQAISFNLATHEGWPEDAYDAALDKAGQDAISLNISAYKPDSAPFRAPVIAVVGGQGPIVTGDAGGSLFQEGNAFASDSIAWSILEAARDDDVEAIVFRVDSPGGSPEASDQIWRAIERAQSEHQKPVVVSMASLAASGGYYVSMGSDWIIANRSTITGSIGIFGGKFAIEDGLARIGVNAESIKIGGPFTGTFTTTEAFSDEQREMMRAWLKRGYDRFISLVAEGRNMSVEEVDTVARGRVWTGQDAIDKGLVDQLGGLIDAIDKAKELAEIDSDVEVRLVSYPRQAAGFPFMAAEASTEELRAIGQLAELINDPEVQAIITELEAARSSRIQARMPSFSER